MKIIKLLVAFILSFSLVGCGGSVKTSLHSAHQINLSEVPNYRGENVLILNDNKPQYTEEQKKDRKSKIRLSPLDSLGRCGVAMEVIGRNMFPKEERKSISEVRPSGWHQAIYGDQAVYDRTHLLGFLFSGLNAEKRNLITGTRQMNQDVMAPYEIKIKNYVRNTGHHVVYRVTPDFRKKELVARGLQLEAWSVEDHGKGICMNIYLYNVQEGVAIDYETGYTSSSDYVQEQLKKKNAQYKIKRDQTQTFIINEKTSKFHLPTCSNAKRINKSNKKSKMTTERQLEKEGYSPSHCCIAY